MGVLKAVMLMRKWIEAPDAPQPANQAAESGKDHRSPTRIIQAHQQANQADQRRADDHAEYPAKNSA